MKRALAAYAIYGLAAVAVIGAAAFAVAALHAYLAGLYGSIQASLIIAGALVVVAGILAVVAMIMRRRKPERTLASTAMMVAPVMAPTAVRALTSKPALGAILAVGAVALGAWLGHQTEKDRPDA